MKDAPRAKKSAHAERFRHAAEHAHVVPLWTFFDEWFPAEPHTAAVGHLWRYEALRPLLLDGATQIDTAEAERRVLALENPELPGRRLATDALYAGLQLIMPHEIAPAHRHSAAALRFVLEGHGAYTSVSGERVPMEPGDLVVTPAWTWHEHGHEGEGPAIWLDVLDVALVRFLGAGFSERYPEKEFPRRLPPGDSHHRFGMGMAPAGYRREASAAPAASYSYARCRRVLEHLAAHDPLDPCQGLRMEYVDPTTGGPAIPTISTFLQWLPPKFAGEPHATTAGTIYVVVEGRGRVTIGAGDAARRFEFGPRDVWVVPSWQPACLETDEETVLFSASDEAVQRKLGLWRERRGH
ncbi:MAG TPA: cupin domain-containing protein [Gammaproteobacteria bacterium]